MLSFVWHFPPGAYFICLFVCLFMAVLGLRCYFICLFVCLFMAVLGLRCCPWAFRLFSSCGERGLLFVAVRGLLIAVASLVAEHGL